MRNRGVSERGMKRDAGRAQRAPVKFRWQENTGRGGAGNLDSFLGSFPLDLASLG